MAGRDLLLTGMCARSRRTARLSAARDKRRRRRSCVRRRVDSCECRWTPSCLSPDVPGTPALRWLVNRPVTAPRSRAVFVQLPTLISVTLRTPYAVNGYHTVQADRSECALHFSMCPYDVHNFSAAFPPRFHRLGIPSRAVTNVHLLVMIVTAEFSENVASHRGAGRAASLSTSGRSVEAQI